MKILCWGLDPRITESLKEQGHVVEVAEGVYSAGDLCEYCCIEGQYDVLIIDLDASEFVVSMPQSLRRRDLTIPIFGICDEKKTNNSWDLQQALFLENGGDGLFQKPIDIRKLIAYLRAVIRRVRNAALQDTIEFVRGNATLKVNLTKGEVTVNGVRVDLTNKEYMVLAAIASRANHTVNKESIFNQVYALADNEPELRIINILICKIRKKLARIHPDAGSIIKTSWGKGYRMDKKTTPLPNQTAA